MNGKALLYLRFLLVLCFYPLLVQAGEKTFTVVIDAGHGGKDPGARGSIICEKEINLSVALKLGKRIEQHHPDVKVIYTRKTDRFVELDERADIANRNKADLFISIHTNAVKKGSSAKGTETYTLGLARSEENLAVAMRENSAILLEENYQQTYEGFDPNSSESYIIFEFIQNKHVEQSISLASEVQKCFTSAKRANRGVRQAGFLVLRKTSMPSILVELGYISNREEERFMKTEAGREQLAEALYNAFTKYKRDYDRRKGALAGHTASAPSRATSKPAATAAATTRKETAATPPRGSEADILQRKRQQTTDRKAANSAPEATAVPQVNPEPKGKVIYKIQILTSSQKLAPTAKALKGYKEVNFYQEKGIYKYTYGASTDFQAIRQLRRKVVKDFPDAFIVAFKDGKKVKY